MVVERLLQHFRCFSNQMLLFNVPPVRSRVSQPSVNVYRKVRMQLVITRATLSASVILQEQLSLSLSLCSLLLSGINRKVAANETNWVVCVL